MSAAPAGAHAYHRSARNYLIDRRFQLRYAGILAGAALVISAGLGSLVWRTSSEVITQGQETVKRGQLVIVESRRVSQVVAMNIAKEYKDDPELAKTFGEEAARDEQKLKDQQQLLEADAASLQRQQTQLLVGLVAILALMVVALAGVGIVFTHKVAGPIFKMKRLLRQIGEGKLVLRERLRKGDELQDFFLVFEEMVNALRKHQEEEIGKVDRILEKLSEAPVSARGAKEFDADGVAMLKQLRADMQSQLEA